MVFLMLLTKVLKNTTTDSHMFSCMITSMGFSKQKLVSADQANPALAWRA